MATQTHKSFLYSYTWRHRGHLAHYIFPIASYLNQYVELNCYISMTICILETPITLHDLILFLFSQLLFVYLGSWLFTSA
jgi:hypothetical protein